MIFSSSSRSACLPAIFALLMIADGLTQGRAASSDGPLGVIRSLYKAEGGGGGVDWFDGANRPRWFTVAVCDLWSRAERKTPQGDALFDFNLPTDTNGLTMTHFVPSVETVGPAVARVAVAVSYDLKSEPAHVIRYTLLREHSSWKIDDISTSKWSLRRILQLTLKH